MKPLNKFNQAIRLPGVVNRILKQLAMQREFLHRQIRPILKEAYHSNDGSLDEKDRDKINNYYGLAVPAILGEACCALRGTAMTHEERWASTAQGAMTGLFDDFFDKNYLDENAIEKMIHGNDNSIIKKSNQRLFDLFYQKALVHCPDKKRLQQALSEVHKAQVESRKQENNSTSNAEIKDITLHKGGTSLIFYRSAFSPAATAKEEKLLYDLGGLMQLSNDIFDVYKDREGGIHTLVTDATHISDLREQYIAVLNECYANAFETGFGFKNSRTFLDIISIGIFSRCLVCLDQLQSNEQFTGGTFRVQQYTRKQLICDMDKKLNLARAAWKHITLIA